MMSSIDSVQVQSNNVQSNMNGMDHSQNISLQNIPSIQPRQVIMTRNEDITEEDAMLAAQLTMAAKQEAQLCKINSEGKHQCGEPGCAKAFTTLAHLARHIKLHSGLKPYKCPIHTCIKAFARRDNMMVHYRAHAKKLGKKEGVLLYIPPEPKFRRRRGSSIPQLAPAAGPISKNSSRRGSAGPKKNGNDHNDTLNMFNNQYSSNLSTAPVLNNISHNIQSVDNFGLDRSLSVPRVEVPHLFHGNNNGGQSQYTYYKAHPIPPPVDLHRTYSAPISSVDPQQYWNDVRMRRFNEHGDNSQISAINSGLPTSVPSSAPLVSQDPSNQGFNSLIMQQYQLAVPFDVYSRQPWNPIFVSGYSNDTFQANHIQQQQQQPQGQQHRQNHITNDNSPLPPKSQLNQVIQQQQLHDKSQNNNNSNNDVSSSENNNS